jgi:hypothetical protein
VAAFDRIPSLGVPEPSTGTRKNWHKEKGSSFGKLEPLSSSLL